MCQITIVDISTKKLLPGMSLSWLITANSKEGHLDGCGAYLWGDDTLIKSKQTAEEFMIKYRTNLLNRKSFNGLYHVRRASVKVAKDQIKDEHAHPHILNDLVLVHNGTLEPNGGIKEGDVRKYLLDTKDADVIDSQRFLGVLDLLVKEKGFTPEAIKDALDNFYGSFVLGIYSKKENKLFVAKDDTKNLAIARITLDNVPVGMILNTRYYNLDIFTDVIVDLWKEPYSVDITELEKNTIWEYTPGTYDLVKADTVKSPVRRYPGFGFETAPKTSTYTGEITTSSTLENAIDIIMTLTKTLFLNLKDIEMMFEVLFEHTIYTSDEEEILRFSDILSTISSKEYTKARGDAITELYSAHALEDNGFDFLIPFYEYTDELKNWPPILNGKDALTNAAERNKKKKSFLGVLQ